MTLQRMVQERPVDRQRAGVVGDQHRRARRHQVRALDRHPPIALVQRIGERQELQLVGTLVARLRSVIGCVK